MASTTGFLEGLSSPVRSGSGGNYIDGVGGGIRARRRGGDAAVPSPVSVARPINLSDHHGVSETNGLNRSVLRFNNLFSQRVGEALS